MGRFLEFDAIRGIVAMVIVLAHLGHLQDSPWVMTSVDLFFVLSGYFITNNILKSGQSAGFFRKFYVRRALRIWPAYYFAFLFCLAIHPYVKWDQPNDAWLYYLTFTQNVNWYWSNTLPRFSGMFQHTWTLAIEEQFYIVWPMLAVLAGRRFIVPLALGFVAVPTLLRGSGYQPFMLLTRCDALALGAVMAWILFDRERLNRHIVGHRVGFAALGIAALLAPLWWGPVIATLEAAWPASHRQSLVKSLTTLRCCLAYFGLAGFVACCEGKSWLGILRNKRLCHVGQISYGLYLYHPFVFALIPSLYRRHVMNKLGLRSTVLMDAAMIALCFLLAELSRRYLEKPFLALKQRFSYEPARSERGQRIDVPAAPVPALHQPAALEPSEQPASA